MLWVEWVHASIWVVICSVAGILLLSYLIEIDKIKYTQYVIRRQLKQHVFTYNRDDVDDDDDDADDAAVDKNNT